MNTNKNVVGVGCDALFGSWMPIDSAPKDRPILVFHSDNADPYYLESENHLTLYGSNCEGMGRLERDSVEIAEWGGAWDDRSYEDPNAGWMPDWWFRRDSDFEMPLNPIAWMDLPSLPNA